MDIYINGRFLTQRISGVQAFAREITRELAAVIPVKLLVPSNSSLFNDEFKELIIATGKLSGHAWEQVNLPRFMSQHPQAVLLNLCNTAPLMVTNQLVTIHDLAFLHNPGWFHPAFSRYYNFLIPRIAKRSRGILTVSGCIKNEIIKKLRVPAEKISIVTNKVSSSLLNATPVAPAGMIATKNFFLMVGSNDPRKNFILVEKNFQEHPEDVHLVIAGGEHRNFSTRNKAAGAPNILKLGYVDDPGLKWLYQNATALINPSFYEGFGIPNLEAMAFGCPVLCSDIPVFREICGEAPYYFDPLSRDDLWNCLESFLNSKNNAEIKTSIGKGIFTKFQDIKRPDLILKLLHT